MIQKIIRFAAVLCIAWCCSFIGLAEEASGNNVTLYLKTGEIIKGVLLENKDEAIVIEKFEIPFTITKDRILRVEEIATNKDVSSQYMLPFSTAIIVYKHSGFQEGEETLYIDAAQNKIASESLLTTQFAGRGHQQHSGLLYDGAHVYTIDYAQGEALAMEAAGDGVQTMFSEQLYFGNPVELKPFLGRECKVYKHRNGESYFWNGIVLKEVIDIGRQKSTKEAISIKVDVPIPEEKLTLPATIKVTSMDDMLKEYEEMSQESLAEYEQWQKEHDKEQQQYLREEAEKDFEVKALLDKAKKADGSYDVQKAHQLMQEKELQNTLKEAEQRPDGEELIKKATRSDGELDQYKLRSLLYKKEQNEWDQAYRLIEAGNTYQEQGQYDKALAKYNDAIALDSAAAAAYDARARLYETMGQDEKAIQDLTTLINRNERPYYDLAYRQRADIYFRKGDYTNALADYNQALVAVKENTELDKQRQKELFDSLGEQEVAKATLWQRQSQADLLIDRAQTYRKMKNYKAAIEDFTQAIELAPRESRLADAYFLRGLVYKTLGDQRKMEADLDRAHSLQENLVEGTYKNGKRHGYFSWYYPNGTVKTEGEYVDGKQEGEFHWYHSNGQLRSKGSYRNDKAQGLFEWYDMVEGSLVKALQYNNGKLEGECKWYYDNGRLKEKSIYKNGLRHGEHYLYYENGQLQQAGTFSKGVEDGTMTLYNSDGSVKKKIIFKQGKRIREMNG